MNASMEFFKSLIIKEHEMNEILKESVSKKSGCDIDKENIKHYSNIKFVNNVLTVILNDGNIISKHPATIDDFKRARDSKTEIELFTVCSSKEALEEKHKLEAEVERNAKILEGSKILANLSDFEFREGSLYITGINRSLPALMIEEFALIVGRKNPLVPLYENEEFEALKRFWMWCCLNPRAEVAEKLYEFLKKNSFKITKQGFFAALRNVVTVHGGVEFVDFVSQAYNKVKAVWKKNPSKYTVFLEYGEYKIVHEDDLHDEEWTTCGYCYDEECEDEDSVCPTCDGEGGYDDVVEKENGENLGNLTELYLDLPNRTENRFTDAHTGTFDIRIGQVVEMPMEQCSWNTDNCGASGLK